MFKPITWMLAVALALAASPALSQTAPAREGFLTWSGAEQVEGYRHIETVFSTHTVARGPTVRDLPVAAHAIDLRYALDAESGGVEDYVARNRIAGLLILHDGEIVLERYGLGQAPTDRWTSFSVGKSITSTLVGAAIRDGHIRSVDEPIATYIPELAASAYADVSIADVLKMRSGVRWVEDYGDPTSDVGRLVTSLATDGGASLVGLMSGLPRAAPAGERFLYSTGESNLLGVLVTRATGKTLSEYLSETIWAPYGMEQDAAWITDGGVEVGGCCISMTLRDYGRFGQFILGGGRIYGRAVLPDGWVEAATTNYNAGQPDAPAYGYQWWPQEAGGFAASGIFGQSILIDPERRLVVVTSSAWPAASWRQGYARQDAFLTAVRAWADAR